MDFASSTRAAENRTRWKRDVADSPVVLRRPSKVIRQNRIITMIIVIIVVTYNNKND